MLLFNRIQIIICILLVQAIHAQECDLTVSGTVKDHETEEGLSFVNIYVIGSEKGTTTDSTGHYEINGFCPGQYHIVFSHIGCDPNQQFIELNNSISLDVDLEHSSKVLEGILVTANHEARSSQSSQVLTVQSINDRLDENLATMLDGISGVSSLKSGAGIGKPIVHGMYGNRLTILNNGVVQSGQQWGNDHSPEIDPLVANRITVIKGVSVLQYPGSNLGSIIQLEADRLKNEPHLHGSAGYTFNTNGRASAGNLQLYKSTKGFRWKVNGTYKISGDRSTPTYFLTNTGSRERNMAFQLEKSFSERFSSNLYFSTFNLKQGVLRGSHIGNLTDLESALSRSIPFFTKDSFSFQINAPYQDVNHHLLKWSNKLFLTENQWLDINLSTQFNNRREFDVRRGGRTETPSLSLQQWTLASEIKYHSEFANGFILNSGVQNTVIDNTNNPETGILPLVPNYFSVENGVYSLLTRELGKNLLEGGIRYDYLYQDVPTISTDRPIRIVRFKNHYHLLGTSLGWKRNWNTLIRTSANLGIASRNPAVNELYSGGLHQGVSGIEEGRPDLKVEQSTKATVGVQFNNDRRFAFDILAYYQNIANYIFLNPTGETRLTIRGAFPVFRYEQTSARFIGLDATVQWKLNDDLRFETSYSYIEGQDLSLDQPLIFTPPSNIRSSIQYAYDRTLNLGQSKVENLEFEINNQYVFSQIRYVENQDFLAPPSGYNLLGATLSGEVQLPKYRVRLFVRGTNILNKQYRDYLNRQRYFADELGINISIGTRLKF